MAVINKSQKAVAKAAVFLKKGGVVICPTDTVYGFLADATNKKAVSKIYKLKKRSLSKPLPVFVKDIKMAKNLAQISKDQEIIIKKRWPGKYTFVLKRKKAISLYGVKKGTIALRVPRYQFLNLLLRKVNIPLAQTSVNLSGKVTLFSFKDILRQFNSEDVLIIKAQSSKKSKSSTIVDLTGKKIKKIRN